MNFASATNLNFYKVFFAVYETGSITQAGEQLFTAPSTISYQVKELENQLSTKLFMPHPRGVSPTHAAVELYEPVVEVETTDIMLNLVAANMGIGCYANESIDSDARLTKIELVDCRIPNFYLVCLYNKKYCSNTLKHLHEI